MPKLTIDLAGEKRSVEVPMNKRLINALIDEGAVDQLHACGGNAKCTSCRVQFVAGKPERMTIAEKDVLAAKGLLQQPDIRLSCQMLADRDMEVKIISRFAGSGRVDAGKPCGEVIMPPPTWINS
jgi:ferredoxin